jgi:HlyD family secretion protein
MTANITVPVARKENVLTVPNAALRFKPTLSEKEQEALRQKMEARRQQREAEKPQEAAQGQTAEKQQGQAQNDNATRRRRDGQQAEGQPAAADGSTAKPAGDGSRQRQGQQIWILIDGKNIEPRFVRTGLTNGRVTEIVTGDVHEGDIVVTGQNDTSGANRTQPTTTPLGQRPPGGAPGGGRPR